MEEKILFFMKKIENLQKIILLIMFFAIKFFLTVASYKFFTNCWIFMNHGLFFRGKYSRKLTLSIWKVKFSVAEIGIKRNFLKEKFF